MEKNRIDSRPSDEDIYLQKFPKGKFLGGIIFVFFAFLIYNLPLTKNIKRLVSTSITSIPGCPMEFREIELGIFLPKIDIHNLKFSGMCNGMQLQGIELTKVRATFMGPSFSPLGAKLRINTNNHGLNLNLYANVSPSKAMKLKVENTGVNTEFLNQVMGKPLPFTGRILIDGLVEGKMSRQKFKASDVSVKVTSPSLVMPKQTINFLELPQLMLGPTIMSVKTEGTGKKQKMKILQFVVGDKKSDIEVELSGELIPNFESFAQSNSNIKGKIKIGAKVTEVVPMSLLNSMVLKGSKPRKGFYHFLLTGPLRTSKPKFQ
jgi:hypothetical protein